MTAEEIKNARNDAEALGDAHPSLATLPNLDSLDARELCAMELVTSILSLYCHDKRHAITLRLKGDIEAAQSYERAAQRAYDRLPAWARW